MSKWVTLSAEEKREITVSWLEKALSTFKICSIIPSRTGKHVQAHISYFCEDAGKRVTRSYTVPAADAANFKPELPIQFSEFCKHVVDLEFMVRMIGSRSLVTELSTVINHVAPVYEPKTLQIRTDLVVGMKDVSSKASAKRDEIQVEKARKNIKGWMIQGFRYGLTTDEIDKIVKESLIESILRS